VSVEDTAVAPLPSRPGSAGEVFAAFLKLGLTSFGGPIAHLGYFRDELVLRRRWLDERSYADLVALCQFLPGPASSQVGFALGLMRGGPLGALAAWSAFTLPSAFALLLFAWWAPMLAGPIGAGLVHGLKLVAVAVVAHAVWGMARVLCPDRTRAAIAVLAAGIVLLMHGALAHIAAIAIGLAAGAWLCRDATAAIRVDLPFAVSRRAGASLLVVALALLLLLPLGRGVAELALADSFYRAGALVFGGGHVVLPLLEAEVVQSGWVGNDAFLAGYGAAQAVPGPLFTFAAYLGALIDPRGAGLAGAAIALVAVFLPGLLLVAGVLPFWNALRARQSAQAALRGANAAVVGILGAALYQPVFTSSVTAPIDLVLALAGFVLLASWRTPAWVVVLLLAAAGAAIASLN
jgi:chromate transporter